jgi:hypothetical protein
VESLAIIKKRVTCVRRKFGETSSEYVAAVLEARLMEIEPMLKHSSTMTTRYYCNTKPDEDIDEDDR